MATIQTPQQEEKGNSPDLTRISKAKKVVDISDNTLRKLNKQGLLNFYRCGKNTFFSRSELDALIRSGRTLAS